MGLKETGLGRFMLPVFGLVFATGLLVGSLWQIEIAVALPGDHFDFPFYLWSVDKWWARDFWYLVNVVSWLLAVASTAILVRLLGESG